MQSCNGTWKIFLKAFRLKSEKGLRVLKERKDPIRDKFEDLSRSECGWDF